MLNRSFASFAIIATKLNRIHEKKLDKNYYTHQFSVLHLFLSFCIPIVRFPFIFFLGCHCCCCRCHHLRRRLSSFYFHEYYQNYLFNKMQASLHFSLAGTKLLVCKNGFLMVCTVYVAVQHAACHHVLHTLFKYIRNQYTNLLQTSS